MKISELAIPEILLLEPTVFEDERGYCSEVYSARSLPLSVAFAQDNVSLSVKGTLRGLHLQHPHDQGKLVMALAGTIWDVAVDVRVGSPTFGKHVVEELSEKNKRQLFVPPGFAHGFCVLSESALVYYKCTDFYHPESELSISYADPELRIAWPIEAPLLSPKDAKAPPLAEIPRDTLPQYRGGQLP